MAKKTNFTQDELQNLISALQNLSQGIRNAPGGVSGADSIQTIIGKINKDIKDNVSVAVSNYKKYIKDVNEIIESLPAAINANITSSVETFERESEHLDATLKNFNSKFDSQLESYKKQFISSVTSMSNIYSDIKKGQKDVFEESKNIKFSADEETKLKQRAAVTDIYSEFVSLQRIQNEIAQSDSKDAEQVELSVEQHKMKADSIKSMIESAMTEGKIDNDIKGTLEKMLDTMKSQLETAGKHAKVSEEYKDNMLAAEKSLKEQKKKLETFKSYFKFGKGNNNPLLKWATYISLAAGGVALLGKAISDTFSKTGEFDLSTSLLSTILPNSAETKQAIAKAAGNVKEATASTIAQSEILSKATGASSEDIVKLTDAYGRSINKTSESAFKRIAIIADKARKNNLLGKQVITEIAQNADSMLGYLRDFERDSANLAISAGKRGLGISTATSLTEALTDFESLVEKQARLESNGIRIDFQQASAAAWRGDEESMYNAVQKELQKYDWNKLTITQRKILRETFGLTNTEIVKLMSNQSKLNGEIKAGSEEVSKMGEMWRGAGSMIIPAITNLISGVLGYVAALKLAKTMGAAAGIASSTGGVAGGATGAVGSALSFRNKRRIVDMLRGTGATGAVNGIIPGMTGGIGASSFAMNMGVIAGAILSLSFAIKTYAEGLKILSDPKIGLEAFGKSIGILFTLGAAFIALKYAIGSLTFDTIAIMAGAAAVIGLLAGSLWLMASAASGFQSAGTGIALMIFSLAAVLGVAVMLGNFIMAGGGLAILAAAAAFIVIAGSLILLASGINGINTSFKNLEGIGTQLTTLISMIPGIYLLATAFGALAASLGLLAITGMIAIPALVAIGATSAVATKLFGSEDKKEIQTTTESSNSSNTDYTALLTEIKGLRNDISSGKITVVMDSTIVGKMITKYGNTTSLNPRGRGI